MVHVTILIMCQFSFIQLVPYRPKDVRNKTKEDNCLISNNKEMLVATLNVGEHFTIIATKDNIKGDDFRILICEEALAMVEEVNKVDYWG